jgi:hypothetical protein
MRRWPVVWLVFLAMIPNVVGSVINVAYNDAAVISEHPDPNAGPIFRTLIPIINAVFFPIAIVLMLRRSRAVFQAIRHAETTPPKAPIRRLALRMPIDSAVIGIACWAAAGVTWPIVLNIFVALTVNDYLQFLASLVMCGVMSAVNTFFVIAVFTVRVLLPMLWHKTSSADRDTLKSFDARLNVFLGLGFSVPFLGIALISMFQAQTPATMLAMKFLSAAGLFGALFTLILDRWVRYDLESLGSSLERE